MEVEAILLALRSYTVEWLSLTGTHKDRVHKRMLVDCDADDVIGNAGIMMSGCQYTGYAFPMSKERRQRMNGNLDKDQKERQAYKRVNGIKWNQLFGRLGSRLADQELCNERHSRTIETIHARQEVEKDDSRERRGEDAEDARQARYGTRQCSGESMSSDSEAASQSTTKRRTMTKDNMSRVTAASSKRSKKNGRVARELTRVTAASTERSKKNARVDTELTRVTALLTAEQKKTQKQALEIRRLNQVVQQLEAKLQIEN